MKIVIATSAQKVLQRMQPAKALAILKVIHRVAADPTAKNNNLKPLKGVERGFRIRVDDWRVSYTLDRSIDTIDVFEISPRGGAYR